MEYFVGDFQICELGNDWVIYYWNGRRLNDAEFNYPEDAYWSLLIRGLVEEDDVIEEENTVVV